MLPSILNFFASYIEKELGIVYSEINYYQLQNRLIEISKILMLKDIEELYHLAQKNIDCRIKQLIIDYATNNETYFFRDSKIFSAIKTEIFKDNPDTKLKVWSTCCSYGQEPYSLAMLAKEHPQSIEIIATDISEQALERAKQGKYTQLEVQRGLPASLLIKYFEKAADDSWVISSDIRSMVKFRRQNLLDSFEDMGLFDVILCRNALIYQNIENKKKIIDKLTLCLKPRGYLVLGAGESLLRLSDNFETVIRNDSILYKQCGNSPSGAPQCSWP